MPHVRITQGSNWKKYSQIRVFWYFYGATAQTVFILKINSFPNWEIASMSVGEKPLYGSLQRLANTLVESGSLDPTSRSFCRSGAFWWINEANDSTGEAFCVSVSHDIGLDSFFKRTLSDWSSIRNQTLNYIIIRNNLKETYNSCL